MKLLCCGDSNTYGFDPREILGGRYEKESRWPDCLAEKTHWQVINCGENGRMVPEQPRQAEALRQRILQERPNRLVILLGTNDLLRGRTAEETAARMETFLQALPPVPVLLLSPPQMTVPGMAEALARLAAAYEALARERGLDFADLRRWQLPLAFDGVHLSEEGHRLLAEHLEEILRKP